MAEENWDEEVVAEPKSMADEPEVLYPALFGMGNPEGVNVSNMSLTVRQYSHFVRKL